MVGGRCVPIALIALLAPACAVESGSRADAGSEPGEDGGGPGPDAPPGAAGLVLEFRGIPPLPAELGGEFNPELEEVRIDLEDVRAVGDAAPGDSRTSRDELLLEWGGDDDDGENDVVRVTFDQAPPGLYSNVFAEVKHYWLEGVVETDVEHDFRVDDEPESALAISIPLGGVTLEAGETRVITIDVSCGPAIETMPWDEVTPDGEGDLNLNKDSVEIGQIRVGMQAAFTYQGDDAVTSGP